MVIVKKCKLCHSQGFCLGCKAGKEMQEEHERLKKEVAALRDQIKLMSQVMR